MAEQTHNIEKLRLEFLLRGEKDNFRFIQNIKAVYYSRINKIFDEVMNEFCGEEEHLVFDKIELDLGNIRFAEFDEIFVDEIKTALRNQLRNAEKKIRIKKTKPVDNKAFFDKEEISGDLMTETESEYSIIKYFLENGILPWQAAPAYSINKAVAKIISSEPEKTKQFFSGLILSENVINRITKQLSHDNLISIIELLESEYSLRSAELINEFIEIIKRIEEQKFHSPKIEEFIFVEYFKQLSVKKISKDSQRELILKSFKYISELSFVKLSDLFEIVIIKLNEMAAGHFQFKSELKNILTVERKNFASEIKLIDTIKTEGKVKTEKSKKHIKAGEKSIKLKFPKEKETVESKKYKIRSKSTPEVENDIEENIIPDKKKSEEYERIYVENAGLVLLHPYLKSFFEYRKLIFENEFVDISSQIKAVHLLQHIISGSDDHPEHLLSLNKILCGIDIEYPVDRKSEIYEDDIIESEKLIQSVIKNWDALKNISSEGFRESFLVRNGIIEINEEGFLLRVERMAYDMLLDKLPWTISMIKLPWMEKIMRVEW